VGGGKENLDSEEEKKGKIESTISPSAERGRLSTMRGEKKLKKLTDFTEKEEKRRGERKITSFFLSSRTTGKKKKAWRQPFSGRKGKGLLGDGDHQ